MALLGRAALAAWVMLVLACHPQEPAADAPGAPGSRSQLAHQDARPGTDASSSRGSGRSLQALADDATRITELPAAVVIVGRDGETLARAESRGASASRPLRPGSTLKPLLAWVTLQNGILEAERRYECRGVYPMVNGFRCFGQHGDQSLSDALAVSCNAYFYDLARQLGYRRLRQGWHELGLAGPPGLVPDETWLAQHAPDLVPESWPLLVGTGHGPVQVTLMNLAHAYARLAGRLAPDPTSADADREAAKAEIVRGLVAVIEDARGTAHAVRVEGLAIAGKTGTAEPGQYRGLPEPGGPHNGWFVGYAPVPAPEIIVAVLVLGGGSAGRSAGPLAHRVFGAWHAEASRP